MIVEEQLKWLNGHWVRVDEFCLWPHANSFAEFASQAGGTGCLVTDAPELVGRILNQDDGRPFRMFDLDNRGSGGLGAAPSYGLLWENPDWFTLAPGTVLPPFGEVITFQPVKAAGRDPLRASRRTAGSGRASRAGGVIEGPYTPQEYQERFGAPHDGGRRP